MNSTLFCDQAELVIQGRLQSAMRTQGSIDFTIGYTIFGLLFNAFCLLLWFAFRRRFEHTRLRPVAFVLLAVLASLCIMCRGNLLIIFSETYPCFLGPIFICLTVPCIATCIIGRLILYTLYTQISEATSKALKHRGTDLSASTVGVKSDGDDTNSNVHWKISTCHWVRLVLRRIAFPTNTVDNEDEFRVLKYLLTRRGIAMVASMFTLPVIVIVLIVISAAKNRQVYWTCFSCWLSPDIVGLTLAFSVIYLCKGVMDWYLLRRSSVAYAADSWGIKREYSLSLASGLVCIVGFILSVFDRRDLDPYSHIFMINFGTWMFVASQTLVQLAIAWRIERKQVMRQRKSNAVNVDAIFLEHVLHTEELCSKFERHTIAEFAVESLYFLKDVQAWRMSYYSVTQTARVSRAKRIFKAYVKEDGLYAVNISSKSSTQVQQQLAKGDADFDMFDEAYGEIVLMLITGSLIRFAQQNAQLIADDEERQGTLVAMPKGAFSTGMGKSTRQVASSQM